MKKIGFIDYFLSEWHAKNYPEWIKENCKKTGRQYEVAYAWAEIEVSPYDGVTTEDWCKEYGVQKCSSIEQVCKNSDYIVILSPDNSEKHLSYAKKVLPFGKPTYIDKTFAPDLATAKKIFDLADKYRTPIFSSSALRFATEIDSFIYETDCVWTTGGGRSYEIYLVHQLEMVVKIMGTGAKKVTAHGNDIISWIIDYYDGRVATLNYCAAFPFTVAVKKSGEEVSYFPIQSDYFGGLIDQMLAMFDNGIPCVPKEQTLEVIALLEACITAAKTNKAVELI